MKNKYVMKILCIKLVAAMIFSAPAIARAEESVSAVPAAASLEGEPAEGGEVVSDESYVPESSDSQDSFIQEEVIPQDVIVPENTPGDIDTAEPAESFSDSGADIQPDPVQPESAQPTVDTPAPDEPAEQGDSFVVAPAEPTITNPPSDSLWYSEPEPSPSNGADQDNGQTTSSEDSLIISDPTQAPDPTVTSTVTPGAETTPEGTPVVSVTPTVTPLVSATPTPSPVPTGILGITTSMVSNLHAGKEFYLNSLKEVYGLSFSENFAEIMESIELEYLGRNGLVRPDGTVGLPYSEKTEEPTPTPVPFPANASKLDPMDGRILPEGLLARNWQDVLAIYVYELSKAGEKEFVLDEKAKPILAGIFEGMNPLSTEDGEPVYGSLHVNDYIRDHDISKEDRKILNKYLETDCKLLCSTVTASRGFIRQSVGEKVSEERIDVIAAAFSLVGKVGYFWGGKSTVIGEDPSWGTIESVTSEGSSTTGTLRAYGLDCSGFVTWAVINGYEDQGMQGAVGDGTSDQWEHAKVVAEADAQPGDLVFQRGPEAGSANHVGILVGKTDAGDWIAVHCSSGQNGVTVGEAYSASFRYIREPSFYPEKELPVQGEEVTTETDNSGEVLLDTDNDPYAADTAGTNGLDDDFLDIILLDESELGDTQTGFDEENPDSSLIPEEGEGIVVLDEIGYVPEDEIDDQSSQEEDGSPATLEDGGTPTVQEDEETSAVLEDGGTPASQEDGENSVILEDGSISDVQEDSENPASLEDDVLPGTQEDGEPAQVPEDSITAAPGIETSDIVVVLDEIGDEPGTESAAPNIPEIENPNNLVVLDEIGDENMDMQADFLDSDTVQPTDITIDQDLDELIQEAEGQSTAGQILDEDGDTPEDIVISQDLDELIQEAEGQSTASQILDEDGDTPEDIVISQDLDELIQEAEGQSAAGQMLDEDGDMPEDIVIGQDLDDMIQEAGGQNSADVLVVDIFSTQPIEAESSQADPLFTAGVAVADPSAIQAVSVPAAQIPMSSVLVFDIFSGGMDTQTGEPIIVGDPEAQTEVIPTAEPVQPVSFLAAAPAVENASADVVVVDIFSGDSEGILLQSDPEIPSNEAVFTSETESTFTAGSLDEPGQIFIG